MKCSKLTCFTTRLRFSPSWDLDKITKLTNYLKECKHCFEFEENEKNKKIISKTIEKLEKVLKESSTLYMYGKK